MAFEQLGIGLAQQRSSGVHSQRAENILLNVILKGHDRDFGDEVAEDFVGHVAMVAIDSQRSGKDAHRHRQTAAAAL